MQSREVPGFLRPEAGGTGAARETRSQAVWRHVEAYLHDTSASLETFAMEAVRRYHAAVGPRARTVAFYQDGDAYKDMRANAQLVRRFKEGETRLPVDLEEALVLALEEPYRGRCLQDLAQRMGLLAAPLPDRAGSAACLARLAKEFGESVEALAPLLDGRVQGEERLRLARLALREVEDLLAQATSCRAALAEVVQPLRVVDAGERT